MKGIKRSSKSESVWLDGRFLCYRVRAHGPIFSVLVENIVEVKPNVVGKTSECSITMVNGGIIRIPCHSDTLVSIINDYTYENMGRDKSPIEMA